jgi:hypothetical protein
MNATSWKTNYRGKLKSDQAVFGCCFEFALTCGGWLAHEAYHCERIGLSALLMAVWRRKPKQQVIVHSDQGIRYQIEPANGKVGNVELLS